MEGTVVPHANLVILTPGHSATQGYIKSLIPLIARLNEEGITWTFSMEYCSHVADAREQTLSGSKQNSLVESRPFHGAITYDKLMWIDSDIVFTPDDVMKLYKSDKDIITGAYLLADGNAALYPKLLGPGYHGTEVKKITEITEVGAMGFGFVCVKSGIFEQLSRPWFQSALIDYEGEDGKMYNFPIIGEDLSWCKRVTDLGYTLYFDPEVKVTHQKTMLLDWSYIQ